MTSSPVGTQTTTTCRVRCGFFNGKEVRFDFEGSIYEQGEFPRGEAMDKSLVITRHAAFIEYLLQQGIIEDGKFDTVKHAAPEDMNEFAQPAATFKVVQVS